MDCFLPHCKCLCEPGSKGAPRETGGYLLQCVDQVLTKKAAGLTLGLIMEARLRSGFAIPIRRKTWARFRRSDNRIGASDAWQSIERSCRKKNLGGIEQTGEPGIKKAVITDGLLVSRDGNCLCSASNHLLT